MRISSEGVELEAVIDGDATAQPVVLPHGITSSHHSWELARPETCRAIPRDSARHFEATAPRVGLSVRARSTRGGIAAIEEAAGRPAIVVGHPLGGITAITVAQRRPDLLQALALEDSPLFLTSEITELEGSPLLDAFRRMRP